MKNILFFMGVFTIFFSHTAQADAIGDSVECIVRNKCDIKMVKEEKETSFKETTPAGVEKSAAAAEEKN